MKTPKRRLPCSFRVSKKNLVRCFSAGMFAFGKALTGCVADAPVNWQDGACGIAPAKIEQGGWRVAKSAVALTQADSVAWPAVGCLFRDPAEAYRSACLYPATPSALEIGSVCPVIDGVEPPNTCGFPDMECNWLACRWDYLAEGVGGEEEALLSLTVSEAVPAVLVRAAGDGICLSLAGAGRHSLFIAFKSEGRIMLRQLQMGAAPERLGAADAGWILVWLEQEPAAGTTESCPPPVLFVFGAMPEAAELNQQGGLRFLFAEAGQSVVLLPMPLLPGRAAGRWSAGLPDDVSDRCRWWNERLAAFPVSVRETVSRDDAAGVVAFEYAFEYEQLRSGGRRLAPIPPFFRDAQAAGLDVTFTPAAQSCDYMTPDGPFVFAEDTGVCRMELRGMSLSTGRQAIAALQAQRDAILADGALASWLSGAASGSFLLPGEAKFFLDGIAARLLERDAAAFSADEFRGRTEPAVGLSRLQALAGICALAEVYADAPEKRGEARTKLAEIMPFLIELLRTSDWAGLGWKSWVALPGSGAKSIEKWFANGETVYPLLFSAAMAAGVRLCRAADDGPAETLCWGLLAKAEAVRRALEHARAQPADGISSMPAYPAYADLKSGFRAEIDLCGEWSFREDRALRGEAEGWFKPGVEFPDRLTIPFARQTDYSWSGWCRRPFTAPRRADGQRVWLKIGGVNPSCRVWINGEPAGGAAQPGVPTRLDITGLVRAGAENDIAIQIRPEGRRLGNWYNLNTSWSGLWRRISCEITGPVWVDDLWAIPDIDRSQAILRVAICSSEPGPADAVLRAVVTPAGMEQPRFCREAPLRVEGRVELELRVPLENPRLWSPADPFLYEAAVSLEKTAGRLTPYPTASACAR